MRRTLALTAAWVLAAVLTVEAVAVVVVERFGYDSHAYWMAWQGVMYAGRPGDSDAYLYSPAFAQLLRIPALLPWPAFATLFALGLLACLVWLLRPLPTRWWLPLGIIGLNEVVAGNVYLVLAVVAVLGFRHPALWAFPALTKVTPCVGPVWFLVRREWRALAVSVGATVAVVAVSVAVDPAAWRHWVVFLGENAGLSTGQPGGALMPPLVLRLPLALALVVWGALTERRWTVPVAMALGTPVIAFGSFMVLFALPRLLADGASGPPDEDHAASTADQRPDPASDRPGARCARLGPRRRG